MDEVIRYCLKRVNITISVLGGIFVPGIYVWVVRNYDKFIEIDIIKILMMIVVMLLPSYLACVFMIATVSMFVQMIFKCWDTNKLKEQLLIYSSLINIFIAVSTWKTNFIVDQDTIFSCLRMTLVMAVPFALYSFIEALFEKKKNKNK